MADYRSDITREEIESGLLERVWQDEAFLNQVRQTPQDVWQQTYGDTPIGALKLKWVENSADTLHLVIPAGDRTLQDELETNPRKVWKRYFGTTNLTGYTVRVLREQPGEFLIVLPNADELEATYAADEASFERANRASRTRQRTTLIGLDKQISEKQIAASSVDKTLSSKASNNPFARHRRQLDRLLGQLKPNRAKITRIAMRAQGMGKRMVFYHPLVRQAMRPLYRARRLVFFWQRL